MAKINVKILLDKSSSMGNVRDATISGFNQYINTLKQDTANEYRVSLTLFNTQMDEKYVSKPLGEIEALTQENYLPDGGTALYDAACKTLDKMSDLLCDYCKGEVRNVIVILTDGQENSSSAYTGQNFRSMVENLQRKDNYTFVYLGANQDSWANAQNWGFQMANVANYKSSDVGVGKAFGAVARGTMDTAMGAQASNTSFFANIDTQDLMQA